MLASAASLLSARRLRAHGLILALCLWVFYLWNISTPGLRDRAGNLKGTDFLHFYTLGTLALFHRGGDLYDMQAQAALAAQRIPAAQGLVYLPLYPPQVSLCFAPFAELPYSQALILWLSLSAALYLLCLYTTWHMCPHLCSQKLTVFILTLAFPAFWHLMLWGQTSALALFFFTLAFLAFTAEKNFLAGLALGCLIFKPQLGVAIAVILIVRARWNVIAGGILSAAAQLAAGLSYYGGSPVREWLNALRHFGNVASLLEPKPYQTHCLRTFWAMLMPWPKVAFALYILTAILVFALAVRCWQSNLPLSLRYSALLLATVLVSPHLTVYDLVILAPMFLLLSDWCLAHPDISATPALKLLLYLAYALPLIGPLARWTHVQLSVLAMFALLYLLSQIGAAEGINEPA